MGRPVLFVLDEDASVLDVLRSDLERRFGNDFSVTGESAPEAALTTLEAMAKRSEPVALLLVEDKQSDFLHGRTSCIRRRSGSSSIATTRRRALP